MAESTKRLRRVVEILSLQALIFQGEQEMDLALEVLGKAFALAQSEGYTRIFLDEGEPMLKLVYQAKSHRIGGGYPAVLLSGLSKASGPEPASANFLIEPLTARELEVLQLIDAGFTNQDIADQLVISVFTVKRHISNIYTKMGASNRTQAISLGRELRLFG
jgi:LuxR family maltose regulon positive regulatory protein